MNADKTLRSCESTSVTLKKGGTLRYSYNRAVPFEIVLIDGSVIKGINPAGEYLEITSHGAVVSVNHIIDETTMGPRKIN